MCKRILGFEIEHNLVVSVKVGGISLDLEIYIKDIPLREYRYFQEKIKTLSIDDKRCLWNMIQKCNKDYHVVLQPEEITASVESLIAQGLVVENEVYFPLKNEKSYKVLPDMPNLANRLVKWARHFYRRHETEKGVEDEKLLHSSEIYYAIAKVINGELHLLKEESVYSKEDLYTTDVYEAWLFHSRGEADEARTCNQFIVSVYLDENNMLKLRDHRNSEGAGR